MVHRLVMTAGLSIAAVVLPASALRAQLPDAPVTDVMSPKVYVAAVDAYAAGRDDAALTAMLRVVPSGVHDAARSALPALAVDAATRPAGVDASASADVAARRWRAAAVLHLDVAWRLAQTYRADAIEPHVRAARMALDRLRTAGGRTREPAPAADDGATFRVRWHIAHLHYLTRSGQHDQFDRAAADIAASNDLAAALWFARGVSHETRARGPVPRVDRRSPARATTPLASATQAGTRRVWYASQLRAATEAYQHVDDAHPLARQARLRMGRTALELGDMDAARHALAPLAEAGCTDAVCGLAWLFVGESHERQSDLEAALAAYRRAYDAEGSRGVAAVALLTLGVPAAEVLSDREVSAPPSPEGWQAYVVGDSAAFEALRDAMREQLR